MNENKNKVHCVMDGAGSVTGKKKAFFSFVGNFAVDGSAVFSVNNKRIADPNRCDDIFSVLCTSNTEDQIGMEWTDSLTRTLHPQESINIYIQELRKNCCPGYMCNVLVIWTGGLNGKINAW